METKNPEAFVLNVFNWLGYNYHAIVPPHGQGGGGLALFWKQEIDMQVISANDSFIDTIIKQKGDSFHATFLYGEPDKSKRLSIWSHLTNLATNRGAPWLITGDFNEILNNSKLRDLSEGTFCDFRKFMSQNDLFDLRPPTHSS